MTCKVTSFSRLYQKYKYILTAPCVFIYPLIVPSTTKILNPLEKVEGPLRGGRVSPLPFFASKASQRAERKGGGDSAYYFSAILFTI